jgi:glutathione synthase/RimK-type ligase-like ATP-grasp enzyme
MKKKTSRAVPRAIIPRTVLIHTKPDDVHAEIVGHALSERGNRVINWRDSDYSSRAVMSFSYLDGLTTIDYRNESFEFNASEVDVVWNRRRPGPVVPKIVGTEERTFAHEELRVCVSSSDYFMGDAFWINRYDSTIYSELKPLELQLAQKNGLSIPPTLISNDPRKIRNFVSEHRNCIYKSLTGLNEEKNGKVRILYTACIDKSLLPRGKILQAAPGIFQKMIEKKYEVRVQFFGNYYAAIAIDSGRLKEGHLDWRIDQASIKRCEPLLLPDNIYAACRRLMRDFGIVSSAFDFIVDKDDNWVFLEINEAGQFLFIEHWCPELLLLDAFCQFVECADADFRYTPVKAPMNFKKFRHLALPKD